MKRILLLFFIVFALNALAQESSNLNFESFLFFKESGNKEQADKYAQAVIKDIDEGFKKKDTAELELLLDIAAYYYSEDNKNLASDLYLKYTNYKRTLNPYLEKHFPSTMINDEIFNNFIFFEGVLAGNQELMKEILIRGFDINAVDINGLSAISYAAFRQDTNTLNFLIDNGINVDFEWKGSTSLHVTCEYGLYNSTRILLEAGANPFLLDLNNRTPRDYASANGFTKVVELLNPYFTGINNKKLNIQIGHKNPIKAMDISPNGELLATSEFRGNSFKLWDVKTKLQVKTVWIGEEITQVSFTSDNKYVFVATTFSSVYRYDLNEGKVEKWLNHAHIKQFGGVKVDDKYPIDVSDSHTVAAYTFKSFGDKNVEVLVFTTEGTITQKIFTNSKGFKYFKFDKTGNILAGVDDDGKLFLWDVKTAEVLWKKDLPGSYTLAGSAVLEFSPDNEKLIVAGHGNNLISYNVLKGKELWHLSEVDSASMEGNTKGDRKGLAYFRVQDLMCMAFLDEKTFVSSGADGTFRFWDLNKGKLLDVKYAGSYPAYHISPVPGTSTIIIAKDKYLIYLDYKSKNMKLFSESFINSANHVFFHQDKLITSNYKQVNAIDLEMGKLEEIYALPDTFQIIEEILPIQGKDEILIGLANPDRNLKIFYPVNGPDQKHIENKHTYQKDTPDTLIIDGKEVISGIMSTLGRYDRMNHVVYYSPVDSVNEGGTALVLSYNYKNREIEWYDEIEDVNYISSFALSPENKYFAFLKNGAEVNLYNIEENQKYLLWNRYRLNEIDFLDNSPSIVNLEDEEITLSKVPEIKKDYYEESDILYFLHLGKANMGDMAVSPERNYIAFSRYETSSESVIQVWDVKAGKEKHLDVDGISNLCFSPSDTIIAGGTPYGYITLFDVKNNKGLSRFRPLQEEVMDLTFSNDGKHLFVITQSTVFMYDVSDLKYPKSKAMFYMQGDQFMIVLPSGYYMSSKSFISPIAFRSGNRAFPFDQFDLKYNRPDIVLNELGFADKTLIDAFYKAYLKRLRKAGFSENQMTEDMHLPEINILNKEDIPISVNQEEVTLKIRAKDNKFSIDRLNIWVNDVPIFGRHGKKLLSKEKLLEENIKLQLTEGDNKIQVSCHNTQGNESLRETFNISYKPKKNEKPDLHLVVISVSDYENEKFNLKYAVKDGRDLIGQLSQSKNEYANISIDSLFNKNANRQNILALKQKLLKTNINDQVVLFISGHGLLDADYNFWFATHDMDFNNPSKNGVSYDEIEWLLDSIPARKKLLLMDACHSGEVDVEAMKQAEKDIFENDSNSMVKEIAFKGAYNTKRPKLGLQNSFELMQELFVNLNRGSGAQVISAAAGNSYALESDKWKNGVFTYSILSGLENYAADLNGDKIITVSELRNYVGDKVVELTNGAQKPTSRQENVVNDFRVW